MLLGVSLGRLRHPHEHVDVRLNVDSFGLRDWRALEHRGPRGIRTEPRHSVDFHRMMFHIGLSIR